uniref:NAD(P)H-quinone oxidoreductase subunit O n=1 Tax=Medicago truncatula TaxID=3880 RepID=B7FML2_MEDTR|nr:unknown [Medicago truncatula]AFK48676.1 unknown [Medicago truncatula]
MYGIVSLLMAFCVSLCCYTSFPSLSHFSKTLTRKHVRSSFPLICAVQSGEPGGSSQSQPRSSDASSSSSTTAPKTLPKKPVYSMKKGQIVRVDKEKYLNSINYLSVGHPPYYKGLDYIYEDRGEVLDMRIFETGEHALVAWVGVPTAPAWLPTYMLIKSEKLNYERL